MFRQWYSNKNINQHELVIDKGLHDWYERVEDEAIEEILNFKSLVERNQQYITNYFINGHTNAIAGNINGKINRFISSNQGTRHRDFFFFRLNNYFS